MALNTAMSIISIDAWADGPNAFGLWRGRWRLLQDGLAVKGRFGATGDRFFTQNEAVDAAIRCGVSDKRNVPADMMIRGT